MSDGELVSVVVPVYNAAATLDECLASVRCQSWKTLEIIVVDDGSTDRSVDIAAEHVRQDFRVQIVKQANAGVAAARNVGIALARGQYIAPIDADDLWAPDKIELQMAEMQRAGETMGLVYTWSIHIDAESRCWPHVVAPTANGRVFREMCRTNLVGNGSCALMRRTAILETGGYNSSLRARDGEGCEDYMLYLSIAEHYEVGVVRKPVTGYRVTGTSMSFQVVNMYRSHQIVFDYFIRKRPEFAAELEAHHDETLRWLVVRALGCGNVRDAVTLARTVAARCGLRGIRHLWNIRFVPMMFFALMPTPIRAFCRSVVRTFRATRPHFLAGKEKTVNNSFSIWSAER